MVLAGAIPEGAGLPVACFPCVFGRLGGGDIQFDR